MKSKVYDATPPIIWFVVLLGGILLMYLAAWQRIPRGGAFLGAVLVAGGGFSLYETAERRRKLP